VKSVLDVIENECVMAGLKNEFRRRLERVISQLQLAQLESELFKQKFYHHRASTRLYEVDEQFPRVCRSSMKLSSLVANQLREVHYQIQLPEEGLPIVLDDVADWNSHK